MPQSTFTGNHIADMDFGGGYKLKKHWVQNEECDHCDGTGKDEEKKDCEICKGTGTIETD